MSIDKLGTESSNQKQASRPITNEAEQQINPSIKFNPRQESRERSDASERGARQAKTPKTVEDAPAVDATRGGL
jgi:hypothetical protein